MAATTSGDSTADTREMRRRNLIVVCAVLPAAMLSALDLNVVTTALPTIATELGSFRDLSLVVTAFLLTSSISTAVCGTFADLYGPKRVYMAMILLFVCASVFVGFSQNMGQLIIARAIQGLGAGGLTVMAFTIVGKAMPAREIGRYQGLVGAVYAFASLGGPLLGGMFTQFLSWRWAFFINVPIGLSTLIATAVLLKLPDTRRDGSLDTVGALLLSATMTALMLLTYWGGDEFSWTSLPSIGFFVLIAVLSVLFVIRQGYATEPVLPLYIFRKRTVSVALAVTFIAGMANLSALVFLPVYLQIVQGLTPLASGLFLVPMMVALMISSGLSGWAISKTGKYKSFLVVGTGVMAASLLLFSRMDAFTSNWLVWLYEVLMGIGLGFVISKLIIAIMDVVAKRDIGIANSAAGFVRLVGSAIGTALLGGVLAGQLLYWRSEIISRELLSRLPRTLDGAAFQSPAAIRELETSAPDLYRGIQGMFVNSLQAMFLVAGVIAFLGFLLTLLIPATKMKGYEDKEAAGEHGEAESPAAVT